MTALPPARFDADRFQRLLALVGPAMAPDLLRQLEADLSACATAIARGNDSGDWTALREASHVLISLSGSAGAMALHGMAEGLNAAAHAQDGAALARMIPALAADLEALIALVRATSTGGG
jgi:HPt (histidine-containing phosphotransfer) domain-containing protein